MTKTIQQSQFETPYGVKDIHCADGFAEIKIRNDNGRRRKIYKLRIAQPPLVAAIGVPFVEAG